MAFAWATRKQDQPFLERFGKQFLMQLPGLVSNIGGQTANTLIQNAIYGPERQRQRDFLAEMAKNKQAAAEQAARMRQAHEMAKTQAAQEGQNLRRREWMEHEKRKELARQMGHNPEEAARFLGGSAQYPYRAPITRAATEAASTIFPQAIRAFGGLVGLPFLGGTRPQQTTTQQLEKKAPGVGEFLQAGEEMFGESTPEKEISPPQPDLYEKMIRTGLQPQSGFGYETSEAAKVQAGAPPDWAAKRTSAQRSAADPVVQRTKQLEHARRMELARERARQRAMQEEWRARERRATGKALQEFRGAADPMRFGGPAPTEMEYPPMAPIPEFGTPQRQRPRPTGQKRRMTADQWEIERKKFKNPATAELYKKRFVEIVE